MNCHCITGTDARIQEGVKVSKKTKKKRNSRRFRWVYIVIVAIFLYVVVQSFFLAQTSKMNYVVAQSGDLEEVASFAGVITRGTAHSSIAERCGRILLSGQSASF